MVDQGLGSYDNKQKLTILMFLAVMDAELRKIISTGDVKTLESNLGVDKLEPRD